MGRITLLREGTGNICPMKGRSRGRHVSEAVRRLCENFGHFEVRQSIDEGGGHRGEGGVPLHQSQMELGNCLEYGLIHRLEADNPTRYVRPGEQMLDDMYGTPDLLDTHDHVVEEIKLTWLSSKQDVEGLKFWKYWVQLKAYCHMMESGIGRLHVCHVNGGYEYGERVKVVVYNVWEQVFSRQELIENWAMIMRA